MPNKEIHNAEGLRDTRWVGLIEELRQWPSDAPEWGEVQVQGFIDQVRLLAEQKGRDREEAGRLRLQHVLDRLRGNHEGDLAFFNFDCADLDNWQATLCPIDQVSVRTKMVENLLAQLDQRHTLTQQHPQNYQEAKKHRTDLDGVETEISTLARQLDQGFSATASESPQTLDKDTEEGDQPHPEPTIPKQDPSLSSSDQEQTTDQDVSHREEVPPEEPSPSEEALDAKAEAAKEDNSHALKPSSLGQDPQEQKAEEGTSLAEKVLQKEAIFKEETQPPSPPQTEEHEPVSAITTQLEPQSSGEKPLPLRSAQDMALLLEEEDSDEHWVSLVWSLLAEEDWAGAYWLARSLKAADRDVPVPPELLAVLQGSHWLKNDTDSLVFDIQQIASEYAPQSTTSERLLGLAAALLPSLVAQHTGLVSWLPQKEEVNPVLGTLAEAVRTFASAGYPLRSEDLREVEGMATREQVIGETIEQARSFLKTNQVRKLKIKRATDVLHHLVRQKGDLHFLLTAMIENKADQIDQVRQRMNYFEGRKNIESHLHQIDQDLVGSKKRKITGDPINQLVRSVEEAVGLARRWCSLVAQEQTVYHKGDWRDNHVEDLHCRVKDVLPNIKDELKGMQKQDQSQEEVALGRVLQRAIGQITGMLRLEQQPDSEDPQVWMQREDGSLDRALARRLLWMPEISLDDDGYPKEDQEGDISKYLRQSLAEKRSPRDAWRLRIDSQDFRFTDVLRNTLKDDEDLQEIEDLNDENLKGVRAALGDEVSKVQGIIEQGMVDGLLVEEERTKFSAQLEKTAIEEPLYFKPLFQRLGDIEQELNQKLEARLRELKNQWRQRRQDLAQSPQVDQLDAVDAFIQGAFDQRDTRVLEEVLAHLRGFLEGESRWESEWFDPPDEHDIFKEFQQACPRIESGIQGLGSVEQLAGVIDQGQTWEGMQFGALPLKCRQEAVKAFRSWHQLKRRDGQQTENRRCIQVLLEYLGFHLSARESAMQIKSHDRDWLYCQVDASASDLARPIPQLGSQANGCYDVVCLWKRPGAESIGAFLRDLGLDAKTVIVFFLGRLTDQRRNIADRARERKLALVILDEILLVFLAKFDDTRLPAFLRCSLPYAALNPYTPFQAGNVPPEMYYGRDGMVRQLQDEGGCIVFGGRQLGKSALLRQVEREFHQPAREQFAWVEDIKLVGDPDTGESSSTLWVKLREGFKKHELIKGNVSASQPDNIIKRIQNSMDASSQRRVLVLFDEADQFLNADAQNGFQEVDRLRALIQATKQRFRIVFTGLHDVQRFNNIVNQPLAHFGQNLLVGPLEAGPARQLVQEPLKTLGYRFADETTVLKVLSYTNYHPGLIQYFCHELLRLLQDQRYPSGPPYEVKSDHVEAVYRSPEARRIIRERLDWTLALDPRYQCIAWAMIYEQKETRDSYVRSFSVAELLELVQDWWLQGFKGVDTEGLRGLLGEMVGLGILVRSSENQYLLRSPNLVRLMGTEEDIENRLLELSDKSQPTQSQPASQHALLDDQNRLYSPLTLVQEGSLKQIRSSGVNLVFGSQALGLNVLDQALKRMDGSEIPAQELTQAKRTCEWLDSHARKQQGIEQVLVYGRLGGPGGDMVQCVWEVSKKCKEFNKNRRRPLQVVFVLNPETAWTWLRLAADQGTDREAWADPIYLRRWDEVGIKQLLSQAGKLDSPEVCQKVLEATGGWPFLLNELLCRCSTADDPRPCAKILVEELNRPKSELGAKLLQKAGLTHQAEILRVLQTLVEYGKVSEEDLEDLGGLVESDPPIIPDNCKTAMEFLHRLECVEKEDGEYRVEPVLARIVGHL